MTMAFGVRGKKRLNRVFDVIGFVYPDYYYPLRKQGKKRKTAASATSSTLKSKKVKVLTHRPKRIETTEVLRPVEGSSSVSEPSRPAPVEAKTVPAEGSESIRRAELPKTSKISAATPRKRRMACVLDVFMESVKVPTPASAPNTEGKALKKSGEAGMAQATSKAGPSVPAEAYPSGAAPLTLEKESVFYKFKSHAAEAPAEEVEFIVQHASEKQLSKVQIAESRQYAKDLKYLQGSLVYSGTDEDDFLYCLPDNK
jgi:hypothetical protein